MQILLKQFPVYMLFKFLIGVFVVSFLIGYFKG